MFGNSAPAPDAGGAPEDAADFAKLWREDISADAAHDLLAAADFANPAAIVATLERVRNSARYLRLPVLSR